MRDAGKREAKKREINHMGDAGKRETRERQRDAGKRNAAKKGERET